MNISKIEVKNYEAVKVASIRYTGKYSDCSKYFGQIFKNAMGKVSGKPMLLCYDSEYKPNGTDCEVCIPVKANISKDGVTTRELSATKAVSCIYTGRYDELHKVFETLKYYAKENSYHWISPAREVYIKGPGMIFKGNPDKYVTEVILPIKG